jgi:hypothetical protein
VTRSLRNWIDGRYPHIREKFIASQPFVKLENSKPKGCQYSWAEGGRAIYAKWYTIRMSDACLDLVPGSDAVARAANSTGMKDLTLFIGGGQNFINVSSEMD